MSRPRVFVTRPIPEIGLELLRQVADVDLFPDSMPPSRAAIEERIARADGLVSLLTEKIDADIIARAPNLKVIGNMAVGYNNIDVAAATARGIPVGNTPGVLTEATADLVVALILAAARRVVDGHLNAQRGEWKTWDPLGHLGMDLVGRTVGIVGLGRIGQAVARRLHFGWNMSILYCNRRRQPDAETHVAAQWVPFDDLLKTSDIVIGMTDLNPSTEHLFNADAFRRMKRSAIFINAARGPLHVQSDLINALRQGTIFAAGLDVTDPEPPPAGDPIYSTPNLVLTPHIASATFETRNKMSEMAARNVIAGLRGDRLPHVVNPEVYDSPAAGRPN